jgi:hypothetical protein
MAVRSLSLLLVNEHTDTVTECVDRQFAFCSAVTQRFQDTMTIFGARLAETWEHQQPHNHIALERRGPDKSQLRLFLVRHGKSTANQSGTVYKATSDHAVPLSDEGREQALQAGLAIKKYFVQPENEGCGPRARRIYVSPYKRARETARKLFEACGETYLLAMCSVWLLFLVASVLCY